MSKFMVTGGGGFIGSHLVEHLLQEGHDLVVVDNFSTGYPKNVAPFQKDIDLREIDIRDKDAVYDAMKGVEYVFHQAALPSVPLSIENPEQSHDVNVKGTMNVLLAARDSGVKRLVFAGSSAAYGDSPEEFKSEDMQPRVKSPYAADKVAAENYCLVFNEVYDIETVVIRYFNVFGPRQDPQSAYAAVIPIFATAMIDDKAPTIFGDGVQSRDFTYIQNIVTGNMLAMYSDRAPGEVFNIACGIRISLLDLVRELNRILGKNIEPHFGAPRAGDIIHSRASIDKARRLLHYDPVISFSEGLERTLEYYVHV
ncbi:MAG TPA: SDR family oxidoreductase [Aggregatilineales bacterium]|nr:SDR family oxidoreductase [Aggregatilineales bacterium]